jgi:exo-1,4-beta-D-glucosaminidase
MKRISLAGRVIGVAIVTAAGIGTVPALAALSGTPTPSAGATRTFADPATGSTAVTNLGASTGWKVLTSATATQGIRWR